MYSSVQLRDHVDTTLLTYPNSIIMGDVNDGPGKEYFENYMLGMDITSELLWNTYHIQSEFLPTLFLSASIRLGF
jgi:hypothetical protein